MKLKLAPALFPAIAAVFAAASVRISTWDTLKTSLITALSVVAAAALVRLARGMPFTAASHYEPDEIDKITKAVMQLARSLRAFLAITVISMVTLIAISPLTEFAARVPNTAFVWLGGRCLSAAIGGLLAYVAVRLFQIVGSDISLLSEQSKFIVRAVHREAEKNALEKLPNEISSEFRTPEGYGQRIQ